ncbi:uncharacterized protein AC631_03035 [Debaryomyces fabryi]|uniref:Uncharacterized protein n=1 Tax=Debaryomyces fabryi TaxID=58627 RepID=A0A0V1PYB5_9ASCO|nr:uncharacterized protein AC631_03035 [Debaryomyces fabryi]KSA01216.1 hypothetical protein AC631_03035 [Debaryomyces fabryi]CUM52788.1 unnamed protein product [Debaryomyces fabryi]
MIAARSFSTVSRIAFQKESVAGSAFNAAKNSRNLGLKWKPTHGNSFRTFAEYRLKAANQSPLAIKLKAKK